MYVAAATSAAPLSSLPLPPPPPPPPLSLSLSPPLCVGAHQYGNAASTNGQAKGKRMGPYRTMSMDIGDMASDHRPTAPEFGPIGHIKNFYDRSHLAVAGEEASTVQPRARLR